MEKNNVCRTFLIKLKLWVSKMLKINSSCILFFLMFTKFLPYKAGTIGSTTACGPRDPSSNPTRGKLV